MVVCIAPYYHFWEVGPLQAPSYREGAVAFQGHWASKYHIQTRRSGLRVRALNTKHTCLCEPRFQPPFPVLVRTYLFLRVQRVLFLNLSDPLGLDAFFISCL